MSITAGQPLPSLGADSTPASASTNAMCGAEVPREWSLVPLGALCSFANGANADRSAYGTGVPFINVLEVITHTHLHARDIPGRVQLRKPALETFAVRRGDVLFNRTSETQEEVGLSAVYSDDAVVVFGGFVIRGRFKDDSMDSTYVGYGFRAPIVRSQIIARGQGAIRANIGQANLKRVLVPVPPKPEQRAIAEALSDVDGLLGALEALIAKKRAIKKATMQQLLTGKTRLPGFSGEWATTSMSRIGATYGGLSGKTGLDFGDGTARYVTFLNVLENVVLDPEQFESVHVAPSESQNKVLEGDLLFNGTSETPEDLAMGAILREDQDDLYLNSFCFGFRIHDQSQFHSRFIAYYFRGSTGRALMYALAQGATRYNMSKGQFMALALSMPNASEQTAIATVLSDMDAEIAAIERRRDKTRAIKRGMMQQLLTGRIRLVEPTPVEAGA